MIPIYKSDPSKEELISLQSCLRNLCKYEIILFTHRDLILTKYAEEFHREGLDYERKNFPKHYFNSLSDYNRLLRGYRFYKDFSDYEYVLICQLDTYIFSGNIDYWLSKEYSYVGAPWFRQRENEIEFTGVGNGGLSLRKVGDFLRVFEWKFFPKRLWILLNFNFKYPSVRKHSWTYIFNSLKELKFSKIIGIFTLLEKNEDLFWSRVLPRKFDWLTVASFEDALSFSFEAFPQHCYSLNKESLPFGCHGWEKYDPMFWREYILRN